MTNCCGYGRECDDEECLGVPAPANVQPAPAGWREALEWYASKEAWTVDQLEGSYGDYGDRARKALTASLLPPVPSAPAGWEGQYDRDLCNAVKDAIYDNFDNENVTIRRVIEIVRAASPPPPGPEREAGEVTITRARYEAYKHIEENREELADRVAKLEEALREAHQTMLVVEQSMRATDQHEWRNEITMLASLRVVQRAALAGEKP